jgi:shikimate dehydrogenase
LEETLHPKDRQHITGKTVICGLIGDPVEHSMSPVIQNTAFKTLNLDYVYVPFRVTKEALPKAVYGMRALSIRGLNVTIPHKVSVLPLLDKIDEKAMKIGAVNTIFNANGLLTGYNTDAEGFIRPLIEKDINLAGKKILVIGSGGAAKAVVFALVEQNAKVVIINRSQEKANELAKQLKSQFSVNVDTFSLDESNFKNTSASVEMIVNTTSIGMGTNDTPIPARFLRKNLVVYDIVYNPLRTRLLREAEIVGAMTISGADMLAWQGAIAFEKWTGYKAPFELMKNEIYRKLT